MWAPPFLRCCRGPAEELVKAGTAPRSAAFRSGAGSRAGGVTPCRPVAQWHCALSWQFLQIRSAYCWFPLPGNEEQTHEAGTRPPTSPRWTRSGRLRPRARPAWGYPGSLAGPCPRPPPRVLAPTGKVRRPPLCPVQEPLSGTSFPLKHKHLHLHGSLDLAAHLSFCCSCLQSTHDNHSSQPRDLLFYPNFYLKNKQNFIGLNLFSDKKNDKG